MADEEESREVRKIDIMDVVITVESQSLEPRSASDELIYLVGKLSPMIKEITGVSYIYDSEDVDIPSSLDKEVDTHRPDRSKKHHS